MKKIIVTAVLLISVLSLLCSCSGGSGGSAQTTAPEKKDVSLSAIMTKIEGSFTFSEDMYDITSAEQLANRYYFDSSDVKSFAAKINGSGVQCDEIVMIEASDAEALARVKGRLEDRLSDVCAQMNNYLPDQYEIASKCKVETFGNYATLFISSDAAAITELFKSEIA